MFRPKHEVRKNLHELSESGEELDKYLDALTVDDYEFVLTGRARGDFLDDEVYSRWAGDAVAGTFPNPEDDNQDVLGVRMQQPIHQEVACTFVRALRDVIAELRSYRNNPLLKLLRGMESNIEITDAKRITEKVAALNDDISSLDEIKNLATEIESAMRAAVGRTYAPSVSIESGLPDSMEMLLQKLGMLVGDGSTSDYRGQLHEQSLGDANLIYLALKLLEYEFKLSSDRVAHFLLIEEPEAHIHTHIQKTLFSNLLSSKTQVIVSTHSTHISSASSVASVSVLAKKHNHAEVYQPAHGLPEETVKRVERYLDALRSTLLFAKGVLLVEGDTEQIMIPSMIRAMFGVTPDELGFSVIAMSSAFFEHVAIIFAGERIQRPCAIATDLDEALIDLPEDPETDTKEQAHARAAEESGKARQERLNTLADGNPWIQHFLAAHTFEVDFIGADNSSVAVETLDAIYVQDAAKKRCQEKLESADIQESGMEILRLAKKHGKGWFALLLSEKLVSQTHIPEYILRAVAFACHPSIDDGTLKQMGEFKVSADGPDGDLSKALPPLVGLRELVPTDFISVFRKAVPADEFSLFCQYVEEYRGA